MRRFFFDPETRSGDTVAFSKDESRHIAKVLRLDVGTRVELLDGKGTIYSGEITTLGRVVEAKITAIVNEQTDFSDSIQICQAILKGEKMDTVVQKCTELGVTTMLPFHSTRCQGKLNSVAAEKKHRRWQKIGLAACKQCMRPMPMEIEAPMRFSEMVVSDLFLENTQRLLFWEEEQTLHLRDVAGLSSADPVALLLGPEGGLSSEEVELARKHGWITVSLGERILRAETATLTAVSIVQFLAGRL